MSNDKNDIETTISYLFSLIESGLLNLGNDKVYSFIDFLYDNYFNNLPKESIYHSIKSLSIENLVTMANRFVTEYEFDILISKSFVYDKRLQLKNKLIHLESVQNDFLFDETIIKSFQFEKRKELKDKLKNLDIQHSSKKSKVIVMHAYLKAISIAASIVIIFIVWQPQHLSNENLFENYTESLSSSLSSDLAQNDYIIEQSGLRTSEFHFRNYNIEQTKRLQNAILLVINQKYEEALKVFTDYQIEKEINPGLTLYYSIALLNNDKLEPAIANLEYLKSLDEFAFKDDVKYHLAFAYLRSGNRKKAKSLFNELVLSKSKYSDEALQTLSKMRWF